MQPPPLRNDCFALPQGVHWTPVDEAREALQAALHTVTGTEILATDAAEGRFLAEDAVARRSNPPLPNSAVDGYGFLGGVDAGVHERPLAPGRSAAGVPYDGSVPPGHALRILTGATVPAGMDTVVLEEDVSLDGDRIGFRGPLKTGANTRKAGEDVTEGDVVLPAGTLLRPQEIAVLVATGVAQVTVRTLLRVGVLSTGDELRPAGSAALPSQIYDANRPMLLSLAARWGYQPIDLGHVGDDRDALRARLDAAAGQADVILTSGGASAGDEDHVSALLAQTGSLVHWRIAIKPGRPLALALWQGIPVFGLPGNPVAAFVCALVFGAPAFRQMAGGDWRLPQGFTVPAAFSKSKKPGRREYLRARLTPEGQAEVFKSEGSGRISGLAWAEGLVEIGDETREIAPGDPVTYYPFGSFAG